MGTWSQPGQALGRRPGLGWSEQVLVAGMGVYTTGRCEFTLAWQVLVTQVQLDHGGDGGGRWKLGAVQEVMSQEPGLPRPARPRAVAEVPKVTTQAHWWDTVDTY